MPYQLSAKVARPLAFIIAFLPLVADAAVSLPPLFGDHMLLQREMKAPIWGKASPGEKIAIEFAGKSADATADDKGEWKTTIGPLAVGDATTMTITGSEGSKVIFNDVLVGDVWIASGQSNMGFQVKSGKDAEKEIAEANYPNIRYFGCPHVTSTQPTREIKGAWEVCSPKTAADFTAVGYFFAREILHDEKVPVGIINNSWGGMPAESFTSQETLAANPQFKPLLDAKAQPKAADAGRARKRYEADLAKWKKQYMHEDPGNKGEQQGWAKGDADEADWKPMDLPQHWEDSGLKIDGAVWFRRKVAIPAEWKGKDLALTLGGIDDMDTTYVNGEQVGKTGGELAVLVARNYTVPAKLVTGDDITIAVRVFDVMGDGGFYGPAASMKLALKDDESSKPISLAGQWKYKVEKSFDQPATIPPRPAEPTPQNAPHLASNIYNAMVFPVSPYAIKGAIWYQGESNAGRAEQYRALFPAMIQDWRKTWGQGDFPFLFVQLANFGNFKPPVTEPADSAWAELREAQTMTLKVPHTAMAVTIDIGDTKDIHPKNKQDVGKRLALAAEALVYGKQDLEYSGPMYDSMKVEGDAIRIKFSHADGLMSKGGDPKGFAIAGEDQKFVWADGKIDGGDVIVSSKDVKNPVAVRYAWADDPKANLYNSAGLPASPFRTDDWKMITAGAK